MHQTIQTLEQSQARFRLAFVGIFVLYLALASLLGQAANNPLSYCALVLYLGFAAGMLQVSRRAAAVSTRKRLNVCIVVDQFSMAVLYLSFGELAAPLLLCPGLASIGYGVRYGRLYAYRSAFIGLVCLLPVMFLSPYWHSIPLAAAGLIIANCCLPVYAAAISQQIRKDNWRMRRRASDLLEAKEAADLRVRQDPLTGLLNRLGLDEVIDAMLAKEGSLVAVAAMDLDGFKQFNDSFGHQAGDELLARVSDLIRYHIAGPAARYGGDEFVFALKSPSSHLEVAASFDKLRKEIAALALRPGAGVSASIGVVLVDSGARVARTEVLAQADKLMYLAKRNGRNRIETSCVDMETAD